MKTNVKTMLMALVATSMVACSNNQDVFDGGAIEKTAKQSYAENFAKKYPNVDMNQNWDFSVSLLVIRLIHVLVRVVLPQVVGTRSIIIHWPGCTSN